MLSRTKKHKNEALHLIPPLRGDLPLKGKACKGASPSALPSYHEHTFLRYIPVVRRLPLEGKLAAVPRLRKTGSDD